MVSKKANCILETLSYTLPMQKLTVNNANIRINESTTLVDFGDIADVEISVDANVEVRYLFLPKERGSYYRNVSVAENVIFSGKAIFSE